MSDLRTLAQAVVDASEMYHGERSASVGRDRAVIADCYTRLRDAGEALGHALGCDAPEWVARAILAALNAERAQGYARAMGEVVEHAAQQSDECHETRWDPCVMGRQDAWDDCYEWARERLPQSIETQNKGQKE